MLLGLAIALSLTEVIRSLLVSVTPTDPATYMSISFVFLVVVALSALIPARRAARVDPVAAIRQQ
jgi:ABC-type antimicrobial peptide transport system permease subunit